MSLYPVRDRDFPKMGHFSRRWSMAKIGYMEGALEQAVLDSVSGSGCARR